MSDLSGFDPENGHRPDCKWNTQAYVADCDKDCAKTLLDMIPKIDRNARAYGWEIGVSDGPPVDLIKMSPANPFLDPNWREQAGLWPEGVAQPSEWLTQLLSKVRDD